MSTGFEFFKRVGDERIERNAAGDTLKKYGGTPTSWPIHTKVQPYGQSHANQQRDVNNVQSNVASFFNNSL